MIGEPPLKPGAVNVTVAAMLPAVAEAPVGAPGTTALTVYVRFDGFVRPPLLVGVSVMLPATVGVTVKLWEAAEAENVSTVAERPTEPGPVGVSVTVPV